MLLTILLVCFVVILLLWFLSMVGAVSLNPAASSWFPWIAVLILGIVVFLLGTGVIVVDRPVISR
jgi:hypothetical protein